MDETGATFSSQRPPTAGPGGATPPSAIQWSPLAPPLRFSPREIRIPPAEVSSGFWSQGEAYPMLMDSGTPRVGLSRRFFLLHLHVRDSPLSSATRSPRPRLIARPSSPSPTRFGYRITYSCMSRLAAWIPRPRSGAHTTHLTSLPTELASTGLVGPLAVDLGIIVILGRPSCLGSGPA